MQVFGFAGFSGSGKTTLIEQLIPRFVLQGKKVSLIKHAHHSFDIDRPGKDSFRHREAGASEVLLSSAQRWVLMHELRNEDELSLDDQLNALSPCDIVLVEGYKRANIAKLEVHRPVTGREQLWRTDKNIVAVASDDVIDTDLPVLDLNDSCAIAEFIVDYLAAHHAQGTTAA